MPFAFAWEFPAAVIGSVATIVAAGAAVLCVSRLHHGPSHREMAVLVLLAALGLWGFDGRVALAKRLFPDGSGVVEETAAGHMLTYGDCAAYVAKMGKGEDDGAVCRIRTMSLHGRYVASERPPASPESPCDLTASPELRVWSFEASSVRDWCAD